MLEDLTAADGLQKQTTSKSNQEVLDLQAELQTASLVIAQLKRENVELKVQVRLGSAQLHFLIC